MHVGLLQSEGEIRMTDPMPEGTRAIVDDALDEAAQTLFSAADVPLARAGELLAAISGPAVKAVLEARIEQIVKHGHSVEADAGLTLKYLPHNARSMILDASDLLDGQHRNLVVGRRRLAKAAAMLLAAIDRVDLELAKGEGQ
jgi:hypothetical protein